MVDAAIFNANNIGGLRSAITSANSNNEADTINITASFTVDDDDPNQRANAIPFVTSEITINGNNHEISRTGSMPFRLTAVTGSGKLTINDLSFSNGYLNGFQGGALYVGESASLTLSNVTLSANSVNGGNGGAIYSKGRVDISDSEINNNYLSNNDDGTSRRGGGILVTGSGSLSIRDSSISGNSSYNTGGGIHFSGSGSLSIRDSSISGNSSYFRGGGIYLSASGSLTIRGSSISGNSADDGGGIYFIGSGSLTISDSSISGNSAADGSGGGMYIDASENSDVTISDSSISGNSADDGGGIFKEGGSDLIISRSSLNNNFAFFGGGIYVNDGTFEVTESLLFNNTAERGGGALYFWDESVGIIENTTISANAALGNSGANYHYGGGMAMGASSIVEVLNSTITDNTTKNLGGGISVTDNSSMTLVNTIISGNNAENNGDEIYLRDDGSAIDPMSRNNLIGNSSKTTSESLDGASLTELGVGSINASSDSNSSSSLRSILQPLRNNGGPTRTHALTPGSPAINAGNNSQCPTVDQRGFQHVGVCDIGSYEFNSPGPPVPPPPPPFNPATIVPTIMFLLDD